RRRLLPHAVTRRPKLAGHPRRPTRRVSGVASCHNMSIDTRIDAWATLAHKALPQRVLVDLLRAFGDPAAILRASRAQLQSVVASAVATRVLAPVAVDRLAATR